MANSKQQTANIKYNRGLTLKENKLKFKTLLNHEAHEGHEEKQKWVCLVIFNLSCQKYKLFNQNLVGIF